MDSGLYAACAALSARTDALDTIANNLANASTGGFRARHTSFSSVLAGSGHSVTSALNQATNDYGVLGDSRLDMSQGSLERTGNDLDVGIDGPGFLTVQTSGGPVYTRSGNLKISAHGQLTTAAGDAVMGVGGVITIPPSAKVAISADGTVTAGGAVAGKLKLVEFTPGTDPQAQGEVYYTVPAKSVLPASGTQVRQGMIESSNVNPVTSVVELINAQRSAETMRHALTMFDSEIDKTAAQDLPRVS